MKLHRPLVENIIQALKDTFIGGYPADKVLERILKGNRKLGARDRRFIAESVYEIVRHWRSLWVESGLDPANYLNKEKMITPDFWTVWARYQLATTDELPDWEEVVDLHFKEVSDDLPRVVRESIPDWIDEIGMQDYGDEWEALLESLNAPADVFLRVNTLRADVPTVIKKLLAEDIESEPVPEVSTAIRLIERRNVFITQTFREGLFEVQDAASQTVAPLLEPKPGERIIDACAGAGGKTLHIGSMMKNKGKIIAMDIHDKKLLELRERVSRNGIDIVETRVIEDSKVVKRLHASADAVLLDVPCSGLGVLRRNPDTKWKLVPEDLERLTKLQAQIFDDYSKMVKTGGRLVYATCSILKRENADQVQAFLQRTQGWTLEVEQTHRPDIEGFDGFYAARLRKS